MRLGVCGPIKTILLGGTGGISVHPCTGEVLVPSFFILRELLGHSELHTAREAVDDHAAFSAAFPANVSAHSFRRVPASPFIEAARCWWGWVTMFWILLASCSPGLAAVCPVPAIALS
jgi:hypothetical protein